MHSESTEMYLITVYRLTRNAPHASTKAIAEMLDVSPPSVSEQIKRLSKQGYLDHEWREGTTLTPEGERIAVAVLRKHRLLETFLVKIAGYALDEIHEEACRMEHAISERLADRLEVILGSPETDPHGHPIPSKTGEVVHFDHATLANVAIGDTVTICQVSDWDAAQLSYLQNLGLAPGVRVTMIDKAPFEGPLTLEIGERVVALAREVAQTVGVNYA